MKLFLKNKIHLILIPFVCFIVIFFWFREGKIISNTTEEELSIYNSEKTAVNYASFWNPTSVGQTNPFAIARFPVFFTLGQLERTGVPPFLNQAFLFWILMVVGVAYMFFLLRNIFLISNTFSMIGGLFYLFNLYSMTQVWKRMLYHGMFAWAYLPLFVFLWIKWIETKKIIWLLIFLLASLIFSYTFSQPAFIITIWTPAGIFVLVKAWKSISKAKELIGIFLRVLAGMLFWCLVNIWWLYPLLTLGSTWNQVAGQTLKSDFGSLQAVSRSFPISEILLLRQSWYFSPDNDFGNFYQNPFIIVIGVLVFLLVAYAIFKIKAYKHRLFMLSLAFTGLFVSKGTSFPLGNIFFYVLFSVLPVSAAFRNSYEKFGIVWLLAYTILFTLGFSKFLSTLKPNKQYLIGGSFLLLILVLVFPFWSGGLFPQKHRIDVPKYYQIANHYLNEKSNDRLFHIPFTLELGLLSYSWGFIGGDPSHVLFDLESITKPKVPLYDKVAALMPELLSDKKFPRILGWLGVGNVILHKDIVSPVTNIKEITTNIENWEGVESKKNIGELVIYSLDGKLINPRIYIADSVSLVSSIEEGLDKILSDEFNTKQKVFLLDRNFVVPDFKRNPDQISFKKISNDYYLVRIKDSGGSYILVLNNTFDRLWQAKINSEVINKHFIVNGFANGWLIDKNGDYEIEVKLAVWPWD